MKAISIQVSDEDFQALVEFYSRSAERQIGRPVVAVVGLGCYGFEGSNLDVEIREAIAAK